MLTLTVPLLLATGLALAVRLLLAFLKFRRLELAIPGPYSLPLLGNLFLAFGLKPEAMLSLLKTLGAPYDANIWRVSLFGNLMVVVSDPDHLQEVFTRKEFTDKAHFAYRHFGILGSVSFALNGAEWRAHRRALQPAFHQSVLDRYMSVFSAEAQRLAGHIRPGAALDVAHELQSAAARAFFWTAVASEEGNRDVERMMPDFLAFADTFSQSFFHRMVQPWLWPDWAFLWLTSHGRRIGRLRGKVDAAFKDLIAVRRSQLRESGRSDSLVNDVDLTAKRRSLLDILLQPSDRLSLSDEDIIAELIMFSVAATDTSAATLSFAIKTLSLRQDVQQRLLQEVDEVLGEDSASHFTTADIDKLEYTERVIKETLRLLPSAPLFGREVGVKTNLGGHTLPAGTTLGVNVLATHRDPRHWPDPLCFDPDRFLPENSEGRHPYSYLPFSAGPRNCVGGRYAMMFMKTLLATLLPRYRIDPVDDGFKEPADFPLSSGLASWMVGGAWVVFTPRAGCRGKGEPRDLE